jgi:hypothetical protein
MIAKDMLTRTLKTLPPTGKLPAFPRFPGSTLQRQSCQPYRDGRKNKDTVPDAVHHILDSSGQPLSAAARKTMEPRFGYDFSRVKVHSDQLAAESARKMNALAYTVGTHIVFAEGKYAPFSDSGQRLLAHELTHVVQQADAVQMKPAISQPGDFQEREAERVAAAVMRSEYMSFSPAGEAMIMRADAGTPASEPPEDENVKFLKDQVNKLTASRFDNDYKKGFDFYDKNKDGTINSDELSTLLADADVGNSLTRWKWVDGVMKTMDANKDGKITWTEFDKAIHS